ncbi:MAG: YezD family protein [Chlamydiota bacterium]
MTTKESLRAHGTPDPALRIVGNAVQSLQFGTVTIKVHDTRIVQIEVTEKIRFGERRDYEKGGGI